MLKPSMHVRLMDTGAPVAADTIPKILRDLAVFHLLRG